MKQSLLAWRMDRERGAPARWRSLQSFCVLCDAMTARCDPGRKEKFKVQKFRRVAPLAPLQAAAGWTSSPRFCQESDHASRHWPALPSSFLHRRCCGQWEERVKRAVTGCWICTLLQPQKTSLGLVCFCLVTPFQSTTPHPAVLPWNEGLTRRRLQHAAGEQSGFYRVPRVSLWLGATNPRREENEAD